MIAGIVLGAVSGEVRADIYRVIGKGNTIAPLRSSEISMAAETVMLSPENEEGGFAVDAVFTMENTSEERITHEVAFPFENRGLASIARQSFKVWIGAAESAMPVSPVSLKVRDEAIKEPRSPHDFAAALVWTVSWEARETKIIRVSYKMGEPEDYYGLVEGWRLRYIVKTGALWKGPIGRADITINLEGHPIFGADFAAASAKGNLVGRGPLLSYPANAQRSSPRKITWHFENWTPDEDVWLGVMRWAAFENKRLTVVRMPFPYAGDKHQYSDALLEQLVDREVAPWREFFPNETKQVRGALKKLAAEWLYCEMFARHGDSFYIGKQKEGEEAPPDSEGYDQNGNYVSRWSSRFPPAWRGGWYKPTPGRGPNGSVLLEELTAQEQKNAEFLRPYFTP